MTDFEAQSTPVQEPIAMIETLFNQETVDRKRFSAEFRYEDTRILFYTHNPESIYNNGLKGSIHVTGPSITKAAENEAQNGPIVYHLWTGHRPTWNTKETLDKLDRTSLTPNDEAEVKPNDIEMLLQVLRLMHPKK